MQDNTESKDVVVHEGEKFYPCASCEQTFTSKYNMQRHVKNVHGEKKPKHKCTLCDATFNQKGNIKRHMAVVHDGVKPFECQYCGFCFGVKGFLIKHIQTVHKGEKSAKIEDDLSDETQNSSEETGEPSLKIKLVKNHRVIAS